MRKIIFTLFVLSCTSLFGQNHFIGLKGGFGITHIYSSNVLYKVMDKHMGFNGGVTYDFLIGKHFNVGVDLLITQRRFDTEFDFYIESFDVIKKMSLKNVSLPLKCGILFGNKFTGLVNIGVIPSYLINAKSDVVSYETGIVTEQDYSYNLNKIDFAGFAEIGCQYKIVKRILLHAEFSYQVSFTEFEKYTNDNERKSRFGGTVFTIGVKYALKED